MATLFHVGQFACSDVNKVIWIVQEAELSLGLLSLTILAGSGVILNRKT